MLKHHIWFKAAVGPKKAGPGNGPGPAVIQRFWRGLADLARLTGLFFLQRRLRRGKSCHGYAERTAAHVRQADAVAELHRRWLAAMLAANAELDIGTRLAALLNRDLHQLADTHLVNRLKRVAFDNFQLLILRQERTAIIAAHAERRLRQIVGAEAEELRVLRDLVGAQRAA